MRTPDINAEMLVGAAGWASGNQTWSGTIPALIPNPAKKNANKMCRIGPIDRPPDSRVANDTELYSDAKIRNPAMRKPVPRCDMTK
jgi:hypothetical protein